ncbi:MAG: SpoVA/SpoVAEb family sporulation membrane protein [Peptococcaceae bacterium]|nr:SpoVA/SpoVAEb family sporulation membrane protein [Peptococcaceae bacterium]
MGTKSTLIKVTPQDYDKMNKEVQPKPKVLRNCVMALLVGGGICLGAQVLINLMFLGLTSGMESLDEASVLAKQKEAQTLGTVCMIFLGALLTGLGWYDILVSVGGAGGILPVTGFANAMVSPAMEYKHEGYVLGVGAKLFSVAGPVLLSGTIAAFLIGVLRFFF